MSTEIRGLVPVLATPFSADRSLDRPSLRRLVEFEVAAGADGLAIFGMASEAFALSDAERVEILADVTAAAPGLPIVAGVNATGLEPARDQMRRHVEGGATCLMVLPPFLVKPSQNQLIDFFGALGAQARALGASVMAQDAPSTGVVMPPALLAQLADLDGVDSVKVEVPPTVPKMCALAEALQGRTLSVLGGQNAQFVLDELAVGAVGTMPACEFTDLLVPVLRTWKSGDRAGARAAFERLLPLIVWGLQSGPAWAIHKEVLVRRGIIEAAAVRAPAQPVPERMRSLLEEILAPLPLAPVPA